MVKESELKALIAAIEKRRMAVEAKRSIFQIETAFFLPLFAVLFMVTFFSSSDKVKFVFFILTIILITIDVIYTLMTYRELSSKQKSLEKLIHEKLGGFD